MTPALRRLKQEDYQFRTVRSGLPSKFQAWLPSEALEGRGGDPEIHALSPRSVLVFN